MDTHTEEDESSSPLKSADALSCHNQRLVHEHVTEDYEEGGNPELKNSADLWSSLSPEYDELAHDSIKLPSVPCDTDLDAEEGGYRELKDCTDHELGEVDEVADEAIKLLSASCDTELDYEEGGNPELKNGADLWSSLSPEYDELAHDSIKLPSVPCDTDLDAEKEDSLQLRKDNSEHGLSDEDEQIVCSLAADGSHLLNIDLNVCAARFYCFTLPEIRTVLQRDKPTVVCISGVERLRESAEVLDLIKGKRERSKDWCFPKAGRIISLTEMNDELDDLKANLLPNVSLPRS
ncbi:uncharacterized protein [Miscanthus floridulus]|uniref:uncharacterized protein isoform X2 n=1 Tax=Miscanthus floridulus TaxID=154761 RepID=UPI0034586C3A